MPNRVREFFSWSGMRRRAATRMVREAVERADPAGLALALASGGDPNVHDKYGKPVLFPALYRGMGECLALLVAAGADLEARGPRGFSILMEAASCGDPKCVELLTRAGADVGARFKEYGSAINIAAVNGNEESLRALIKAGADVESSAKETSLWTPLLQAAWMGHGGCLRILIEAGANVEARDEHGRDVLHCMEEGRQANVLSKWGPGEGGGGLKPYVEGLVRALREARELREELSLTSRQGDVNDSDVDGRARGGRRL